jgi:DNA topoisomerase-1
VQARDYVKKVNNKLIPSDLGRLVIEKLVADKFDLADLDFTRRLEESLDSVAEARGARIDILKPFHERLQAKIAASLEDKGKWWPEPEAIGEQCPECGKDLKRRWGRNGPFIGCDGYPECKYTRPVPVEGETAEMEASRRPELTDHKCELCGAQMMKRWGRNGFFLGCSTFPKCKFTRNVPLGIDCPKCGGEIIEIRGKKQRRPFYGCNNFRTEAKCDFRIWQKPVLVPCPQCKAKFVVRGGKAHSPTLRCVTEGCGWERPLSDDEQLEAMRLGDLRDGEAAAAG